MGAGSASRPVLCDLEPGPCLPEFCLPLGVVHAREVSRKAGDWQAWGRREKGFWPLPWVRRALTGGEPSGGPGELKALPLLRQGDSAPSLLQPPPLSPTTAPTCWDPPSKPGWLVHGSLPLPCHSCCPRSLILFKLPPKEFKGRKRRFEKYPVPQIQGFRVFPKLSQRFRLFSPSQPPKEFLIPKDSMIRDLLGTPASPKAHMLPHMSGKQ